MKLKRIICLMLVVLLLAALCGCGKKDKDDSGSKSYTESEISQIESWWDTVTGETDDSIPIEG